MATFARTYEPSPRIFCRISLRVSLRVPRRLLLSVTGITACMLAVLMVAPVAAGSAQSSVEVHREALLLDDVLAAVAHANPRLDAARARARAALNRVPGVTRPPDPQLQIGWMNYELPSLRPMQALGMTQIQLMQMIPVAGKLRLAGQVETARAQAEEIRVSEVDFDLRNQAAMAFYDLYATEGSLQVALETRRLLADIAAIANRMYEVGDGRQADVLRASVEVARMQEEIIRMQTMRAALHARLNALLIRRTETLIGVPKLPEFPAQPGAEDSLTALAAQHRPMLRAADRQVDAARASAQLSKREIWPDLLVGVQYGQRSGMTGTEHMGSLMIGASLPVFAGKRQYPMRAEADAMLAMAQADLAAAKAETDGAVAIAYSNLRRARRLADLYRTSVLPQAEAAVTSSRAAYRVGSVPFMTLIDAQMTLNRYRTEVFTLEADEGRAWAELEMLTGRVLTDARSAAPTRSRLVPPRDSQP